MRDSTFLGRRIYQTPRALQFWEELLSSMDFKRVVEFGTTKGNFSIFFLLTCIQRKAEFFTYDIIDWKSLDKRPHLKNLLNFDHHFFQLDIFKHEEGIGKIIQSEGRTILFCDNGDKPREFRTFAKYLKVGDVIAVHDWGTEIGTDDILEIVGDCNLRTIFVEESKKEGMTKVLQRYA